MPEATINKLNIEITGSAKGGSSALDETISKLNSLIKVTDKFNSSQSKIDSVTNKSISSFSKLHSKLNLVARVLDRITDYAAEWFKESNDYIEAVNLFNVSMGKGADQAKRYAESLQNLMGIDIKDWMNFQGSFNQILSGFGVAEDRANQMSQQLTQLTYDISSYKNISLDTAFRWVQSGMSGQIKGLKNIGVNLSIAQLKEVALAHGIELSTAKMTERQKAMLRYVSLLEQTTNIQNDMARTITTPANSMRILTSQIDRAKRALGNIVSTIIVKFIPVMQTLVLWIERVANKIAEKLGFNYDDYFGKDYQNSLNSISSVADDMSENFDDANKEAKKLKKTLMGFDELNVLNAPTDTSSTSSILGGGLPDDLGLWDYADSLGYDFTKGLKGIDTSKIEQTLRVLEGFIYGFAIAIGLILLFTGHPAIGLALIIMGTTAIVAETFTGWKDLSPEIQSKLAIITGIVAGAVLAIGAVITFISGQLLIGIPLLIAGAALLVSSIALNWNATKDKLKAVLEVILAVVSGAMLALGAVLTFTGTNPYLGIPLMIIGAMGLAAVVALKWNFMPDKIKPIIQLITGILGGALLVLGAILTFTGANPPLGIGLMIVGAMSLATSALVDWNSTKNRIKSVLSAILSIISGAGVAIGVLLCLSGAGVGLGIALIRLGLKGVQKADSISSNPVTKWIKDVCNKAIGLVEKTVNKCIDLINMAHFDFVLPPIMGGGTITVGFSNVGHVSIPRLAEGGLVDKGQMFIARESGAELVASMSNGRAAVMNNDQIVQSVSTGVYRAVKEAMSDSSGSSNINLVVTLDGDPVYRNTVKRHNDEVKATGSSPLLVGA